MELTRARILLLLIVAHASFGSALGVAQDATDEELNLATDEDGDTAQPAYDPQLDEAARITFTQGREAFDRGDYEVALQRFRQAYELSPRPTLLYNIAASLDRLRRDEEAADALRAYLEAVPDAHDRTEVEGRLRVLDQTIAERRGREEAAAAEEQRRRDEEAARQAAEEQRREEEERRRREAESSGLHPAIAIAVGGAALVAGGLIVWSGLDANSKNDEFEAFATTTPPPLQSEAQPLFDDVRSAERRTNALIGVAAGLAVVSGVLFIFTDFGGDEDGVAVSAGPTRGGAVATLGGSF